MLSYRHVELPIFYCIYIYIYIISIIYMRFLLGSRSIYSVYINISCIQYIVYIYIYIIYIYIYIYIYIHRYINIYILCIHIYIYVLQHVIYINTRAYLHRLLRAHSHFRINSHQTISDKIIHLIG